MQGFGIEIQMAENGSMSGLSIDLEVARVELKASYENNKLIGFYGGGLNYDLRKQIADFEAYKTGRASKKVRGFLIPLLDGSSLSPEFNKTVEVIIKQYPNYTKDYLTLILVIILVELGVS